MDLITKEELRASGIGKVINSLAKNPKETEANRRLAHQIFLKWARPILKLEDNFEKLEKTHRKSLEKNGREAVPEEQEEFDLLKGERWHARVPGKTQTHYLVRPMGLATPTDKSKSDKLTNIEKTMLTAKRRRR